MAYVGESSVLQGKKADDADNSTRCEFCVNVRNSLTLAEKRVADQYNEDRWPRYVTSPQI